ncbi:F-box domain containing protein [Trema orientale]|uniref:F-box domain containing protein n=1 Tax=Trema orientale TaxID=63057 RepID=A0A2P5EQK8_TREOI|nr:F-box domain containing protein [Trema orientale]
MEDPTEEEEDQFSKLPDPVIIDILSLLSTFEAVQMSILSKRLRRMWYSLPVLCFHDCSDGGFFDLRKFNKFVQTCLEKTRKNDLLNVTDTPLTKIEFVLRQPQKKSVTDDLYYVRLWRLQSVSLPSLASLNLERVKLNDEALHKLVLGSPCLKELILDDCEGISRPIISSLSLKLLEAHSEYDEVTFHVGAANLESFLGTGVAAYFEFGLSSYGTLRELSLIRSRFADWWLEELFLKLPLLERGGPHLSRRIAKGLQLSPAHSQASRGEDKYAIIR